MVKVPAAQPAPRVPRSRRDDRYEAGRPPPPKRAVAGWVESVQDDSCTVVVCEESLTGVVYLGVAPAVGDIVEVESRGDLLVTLTPPSGGGVVHVGCDNESFDEGVAGAVITTANSAFSRIGGAPVFTSATADTAPLSATASSGATATLDMPFDVAAINNYEHAFGAFAFRFTGSGGPEADLFVLFATPQAGDVYAETGTPALKLVRAADGRILLRRYAPGGVSEVNLSSVLSINTWYHASFELKNVSATPGGGTVTFLVFTADELTNLYSMGDQPVAGSAFGWVRYSVTNDGGFQNWLDEAWVCYGGAF